MTTILVVEDNADLREMYQEILSMVGHTVRSAETAAEAIAALSAERPAVLVLDLGIAGGVEPVLAAAGTRVGVILASGARDLPQRAAALGAAESLLKPFGPEQLLAAVERVTKAR